jgi:hypothetical protein
MLGKSTPLLLTGVTIAATTNFINLWYPESCEGEINLLILKVLQMLVSNGQKVYLNLRPTGLMCITPFSMLILEMKI